LEYQEATAPEIAAGFAGYTNVINADGLRLPRAQEAGVANSEAGVQWAQYYTDHFPNTVLQLAVWLDYENHLDDINNGLQDAKITSLGQWIKNTRKPVYLRIGYEFDNEWSIMNSANPTIAGKRRIAAKYKLAYNRIAHIIRDVVGAGNVTFVWHSYAQLWSLPNTTTGWLGAMEYYPGDEYVQWVAISYFEINQNQCIQARNYIAQLAVTLNKPLMIAESAAIRNNGVHNPNVWNNWFVPYFNYITQNNVKLVSYISVDFDDRGNTSGSNWNWNDARVQADPAVFLNWRTQLQNPRYLKSSSSLYQTINFR
jgi:hypothetical protein